MNENEILNSLKTVMDPELGINVVDLGLIYGVSIDGNNISIRMTMTSQACPLGDFLKSQVEEEIRKSISGVGNIEVVLLHDPPWTSEMMSDEARKQLGR